MHDMALESGAYRLTELKSERMRTGALIVLGVVFVAVVLLRDVMFGSEESRASLPSLLLLLAAFMLFETWMLWRVAGALATESSLPNGTRSLKVVVEALVPTVAIVLATMGPLSRSVPCPHGAGHRGLLPVHHPGDATPGPA